MNAKKPYDKKNNDTYVEMYANNMQSDVEKHMFKNDNSNVVSGNIRGDFSVQSQLVARNNVLHFESPSTLGLRGIKAMDMRTLVPYSLMKRYAIHFLDCEYTQKTPIYFNVETEKFVLSMDNRVLRDIKEYPEFINSIDSLVKSGDISLVDINGDNQLLLNYDTMDALKSDATLIYEKVKTFYENALMELYPTEDVIIVLSLLTANKENYLKNVPHRFNDKHNNNHEYENSSISFEFVKAKKISNSSYYLYDKNNNLIKTEKVGIDKNKAWKDYKLDQANKTSYMYGLTASALVIPYTKLDWDLLVGLRKNIDSIFNDLDKLLLTQKTKDGLDGSLQDIKISDHMFLKLEQENKQLKLK